jgi:hypothetical protein
LAAYAPQLTIRGFGGEFEKDFEALYEQSVMNQCRESQVGSRSGIALTNDGSVPACHEIWALRHPTFGNYHSSTITCNFVQGELMGLPVKVYETIDYIVWFLSNQSIWIPKKIHKFLLDGFKDWPVWIWYRGYSNYAEEFVENQTTGALFHAMFDAKTFDKFKLTKDCIIDMETRFSYTAKLLGLIETADTLARRFLNSGFIEAWFKKEASKPKS